MLLPCSCHAVATQLSMAMQMVPGAGPLNLRRGQKIGRPEIQLFMCQPGAWTQFSRQSTATALPALHGSVSAGRARSCADCRLLMSGFGLKDRTMLSSLSAQFLSVLVLDDYSMYFGVSPGPPAGRPGSACSASGGGGALSHRGWARQAACMHA